MLITNFASGELSKKMSGRIDLQQYYGAASHLKNFNIIPTGGLERRSGSERLGKLSGACRIIPFILDSNTSFILEFTPLKTYVWKNGEKMVDTDGNQIEIETPYSSMSEIEEIQYAQDFDTMVFVQRNYTPFQIKYDFALNIFDYGPMSFDFYPDVKLDNDYEDAPITICDETFPANPKEGDYAILNGRLYKYSEKDTDWINNDDDPETDEDLFTTENKYPGCVTFFNNRLYFASTVSKRQKVWASATPDTKGTRYNSFATYQKYITVNKAVKDSDLHMFTADVIGAANYSVASFSSDLPTAQTQFASGTFYYKSGNEYVVATAYTAGTTYYTATKAGDVFTLSNLSQDLKDSLAKDVTLYYCSNNNYIKVGTKVTSIDFDNKTITLDTPIQTNVNLYSVTFTIQLWKDATSTSADDYEYQVVSSNTTTSDCSFNFELASDQNDGIKFLAANQSLAIGTESSIWSVPPSVTALNVYAQMNGRYGSDGLQAHCVDSAVIFFAQGLKGIREYYYNSQNEAFQTNNIALMAEQMLTESRAKDFDFMTNPYNRILITREDGTVASLLYDKNNGVMGWTRIVKGGPSLITSCAVTRGDNENDIIYFTCKEGENYYLERIDEGKEVYLDSWKKYETGDEDNYSADAIQEDGYIGYKFESKVVSMPVIANDPTSKKRIVNLLVRFLDSYLPVMECEANTEYFNDKTEPYSGIAQIDYPGVTDRDVTFTISIDEPKRCNILSVNAKLS